MSIWKRLFYLNAWSCGYRKIGEQEKIEISKNRSAYTLIRTNDATYYADPFLFEKDGEVWLFAEKMNRYIGKGTIAVSKMEHGRFRCFSQVLEESFHLSYPNVFSYNNQIYMIPETSEAMQIRLYRAEVFPTKWGLDTVLRDGKPWVDSSLYIRQDRSIELFTTSAAKPTVTERYLLDMDQKQLIPLQSEGRINERAAGNAFEMNGICYRPLQDCEEYYGKAIMLAAMNDNEESIVRRIETGDLRFTSNIRRMTGVHTLNRSETYEVIDFKYDRFCITKPWMTIVKRIRKGTVQQNHDD